MAEDSAVYDAHEILDEAGVNTEAGQAGLAERLRLLIAERDQLRRQLWAGQCLRMAAWCKQMGADYDAYRTQALALRPELAEQVPEADYA